MRLREFSRTDCPATGSPKRLDVLVRPGVVPPASATESVRIASLGAETSSMTPMEVGSLTKATTGLVIADADPPRVRPRRPVGLRAPRPPLGLPRQRLRSRGSRGLHHAGPDKACHRLLDGTSPGTTAPPPATPSTSAWTAHTTAPSSC